MTKKKLIWYPGAMYHITTRGNRKNNIFQDQKDYLVYLDVVKEAIEYYENSYEIIAYALMTNHVHIQIKTKDKHICYLMGRINKNYARDFNIKYDYVGHVFQARYNAELISNVRYILEASRYIHLNPVRANMVKQPEEYRWSSYSMYIGEKKEKLINSKEILDYFAYFVSDKGNQRKLYKTFVEQGIK